MANNNWPIENTAEDYFRQTRKRMDRLERIAAPVSVADMLGPGMSSQAVNILDWNDEVATFNGYYYSVPGSFNTPVIEEYPTDPDTGMPDYEQDPITLPSMPWTGMVIAREDRTGMQQVWNTDEADTMWFRVRNYWPNPEDPDAPVVFGEWQKFATPSGFVEGGDLAPPVQDGITGAFDTAKEALEAAGEAIGLMPPLNYVFYQPDMPVDEPDTPDVPETPEDEFVEGRALLQGDFWFDTDDSNRQWTYDGSAWVNPADSIIAGGATAAQAAAAAAAHALEVAEAGSEGSGTTIYYQTSEPTGGTYVLGDTWIDTDNGNKPHRWTGAIWTPSLTGWLETDGVLARGIKVTTAALMAYSNGTLTDQVTGAVIPAGSPTFSITAANGAVAMLGSLTSGSSISGAKVTGGVLQTHPNANTGIKIYDGGLIAYGGGIETTVINAATGVLSTTGGVLSGGSITGSSITASATGVIQTESLDTQGVKMNSNGIVCYAGPSAIAPIVPNQITFSVYAPTGEVAMAGGVVSGATIQGGTFRTAAVGTTRVEMSQSAGSYVKFYNDSTWTGSVYSQSGVMILGGPGPVHMFLYPTYAQVTGPLYVSSIQASSGNLTANGGIYIPSGGISIGGGGASVTGGITVHSGGLTVNGGNISCAGGTLQMNGYAINGASAVNCNGVAVTGAGNTVTIANPPQAGSANVNWNSSGGGLRQIASSRRFKTNIRKAAVDLDAILALRPVHYDRLTIEEGDEPHEIGFIAEEAVDLGLSDWVWYDEDGRVQGFDYYKWVVALHAVAQDLKRRIDILEGAR